MLKLRPTMYLLVFSINGYGARRLLIYFTDISVSLLEIKPPGLYSLGIIPHCSFYQRRPDIDVSIRRALNSTMFALCQAAGYKPLHKQRKEQLIWSFDHHKFPSFHLLQHLE